MTTCVSNLSSCSSILSLPNETIHELASALGCVFSYISTSADAYQLPSEIPESLVFMPAIVPGTITQLVDSATAAILDQQDHWLKTAFSASPENHTKTFLQLDGLLTYADVFLNDVLILQSRNAFHAHVVDVSKLLKANNQLTICFRAIAFLLAQKQMRARFPTRLINERHLRFIRTPTLGYMPGFSSIAKLVGAFRSIKLITQQQFVMQSAQIKTGLINDKTGQIFVKLNMQCLMQIAQSGFLVLIDEDSEKEIIRKVITINVAESFATINADFEANDIEAYWPHTHGIPKRYLLKLILNTNKIALEIVLGRYGFRMLTRANPNNFALQINNTPLFLRGACWTPMNPLSLQTTPAELRQRLLLLKQAGINILRLPGNMPYECDDFYDMCDELGLLIMQDFAFTNFDYPEDNVDFVESVQSEAITFLAKHGNRACLTLLAGNSEVAQQAAMMGINLDKIHNTIFDDVLKKICAQYAPNVPYVNSSPNSNGIPFHAGNDTSHYYGVGGYRRSFEDARLFKGQFIAECLAFSHVPENTSLYQFFNNEFMPAHHPRWKEGVPRDNGAGWDFADITDFYIEQLFDINPTQLRITEPQRYLDFCRVTSCEVVERTMNILRADSKQGRAALVWYLHDLKQGAGWGYIDSLGVPKSAFYGLARASQTTTILFVDEGLEGLAAYIAHDGAVQLDCQLEIALITSDGAILEQKIQAYQFAPRSITRVSIDVFLGRFVDSSYAYKFGARSFVACAAKLVSADGQLIAQKIYADPIVILEKHHELTLTAHAKQIEKNSYVLTITSNKPAFFVTIDANDCILSDNYGHVMPHFDALIGLQMTEQKALHGRVHVFNHDKSFPINIIEL